jgi:hypothetical protein
MYNNKVPVMDITICHMLIKTVSYSICLSIDSSKQHSCIVGILYAWQLTIMLLEGGADACLVVAGGVVRHICEHLMQQSAHAAHVNHALARHYMVMFHYVTLYSEKKGGVRC